jgi:hypothetical protein
VADGEAEELGVIEREAEGTGAVGLTVRELEPEVDWLPVTEGLAVDDRLCKNEGDCDAVEDCDGVVEGLGLSVGETLLVLD